MPTNAAQNIDEFNAQARSFVAKAKEKGLSNTAMANTIKFMYGSYLEDQKNKITPYQQAVIDESKKQKWTLYDVDGDGVMDVERDQYGNERAYNPAINQDYTEPDPDLNDTTTPDITTPDTTTETTTPFDSMVGSMTADEMRKQIKDAGQTDIYGVLGEGGPNEYEVLKKGADYMAPGAGVTESQQIPSQPKPESQIDLSKGLVPLAAGKTWDLLKMAPSTLGNITKKVIENQIQGKEEFGATFLGQGMRGLEEGKQGWLASKLGIGR